MALTNLGDRLRDFRVAKGYSVEDLGVLVNRTPDVIRALETGFIDCDDDVARLLREHLGITADKLRTIKDYATVEARKALQSFADTQGISSEYRYKIAVEAGKSSKGATLTEATFNDAYNRVLREEGSWSAEIGEQSAFGFAEEFDSPSVDAVLDAVDDLLRSKRATPEKTKPSKDDLPQPQPQPQPGSAAVIEGESKADWPPESQPPSAPADKDSRDADEGKPHSPILGEATGGWTWSKPNSGSMINMSASDEPGPEDEIHHDLPHQTTFKVEHWCSRCWLHGADCRCDPRI